MLFMKKDINLNCLNSDEKKQITVLSLVVVMTCIILFGTSYAWFVVNTNSQKSNELIAGNLNLTFDDTDGGEINLTGQIPVSDEEGLQTSGYTFKVKNEGNIESNYSIFLDDLDLTSGENRLDDRYVKYSLSRDNVLIKTDFLNNLNSSILDSNMLDVDATSVYTLRLWLDEDLFDRDAANKTLKKKLRIEASQKMNSHIVEAYTYNQAEGASNYCVTGEESTCQKTACYGTRVAGSCPAGTIIKYEVNDTELVLFHVMFDNGNTITMQSQRDTLSNVVWADSTNVNGPTTVLPVLEKATETWKNVNDQTYTMGTTIFKENAYTTCSPANNVTCTSNGYTLPLRTAKARMMVVQEAKSLGCNYGAGSCSIWMHNYLADATKYGGTVDGTDYSYWMMNSSSSGTRFATGITTSGYVETTEMISSGLRSARAVVEINK